MITNPALLLDMDGVCANFIKAASNELGIPDLHDEEWPINNEDVWAFLPLMSGMDEKSMWKFIGQNPQFWHEMEEYPWFDDLYGELKKIGEVIFVSKPTIDPQCCAGKVYWLQQRLGLDFRNYVLTSRKELLATPTRILIDDDQRNYERFLNAGGKAILFPQPWNDDRHFPGDRVSYVIEQVQREILK